MTTSSGPSITGVILAGGQGRRMDGQDKGLLDYHGQPLIRHLITAFTAQVDDILINANRHHTIYQSFGYPVISDEDNSFNGPLAGMLSALKACESQYILTIPCDSPAISPVLRQRMMECLLQQQADIAVAHDGDRLQPVFCLIAHHLVDDLAQYLAQGERKIDVWFARHNTVEVDFSDQKDSFINFNHPEDITSYDRGVSSPTPLIGFSAYSGTGKTTLLQQLIPLLTERNLRVAVIKHAHHLFDIDIPGKDSYKIREAGAQQTLVASSKLMALMQTAEDDQAPRLTDLIQRLDHSTLDLVLVEGFKHESFNKIELHRPSIEKPFLYPDDNNIIAIASDETLSLSREIDTLDLNQIDTIADYIVDFAAKWNP